MKEGLYIHIDDAYDIAKRYAKKTNFAKESENPITDEIVDSIYGITMFQEMKEAASVYMTEEAVVRKK